MISEEKRKEIFAFLGYEYSKAGIRKFQSDYMSRETDIDGVWGKDTENAVLTVYYTKKYTKNFDPKEFKCECKGKWCCGFPDHMKISELKHVQKIRDHYGKPMVITSALRCPTQNSRDGGISGSRHLSGCAVDFYMAGVTDTLGNRKASISWIKKQANHRYTYGNGIDSDGSYRSAPGMGNAMHTEVYDNDKDDGTKPEPKPTPTPEPTGKIPVNGKGDAVTVKAAQVVFGMKVCDGTISGQIKSLAPYYKAWKAVSYGGYGSSLVMAIQKWAGCTADGTWGKATSKAVQKKLISLGYDVGPDGADGFFGADSMKAFQKFLNAAEKVVPEPRYKGQVIDISYVQKNIDFKKVKEDGIVGAIIRCGFRGYGTGKLTEDEQFMNHIKGAKKAGLKIGIYFFTEAINEKEGRQEARYTLELIKKAGITPDYPIAVDTEWINADDFVRANNISKAARTAAIKGFCDEIEKAGYKAMIYASLSWFDSRLDMSQLSKYQIWCAQYYSKCQYKGKYIFWQYTSEGAVAGVKGVVDMNRCYL